MLDPSIPLMAKGIDGLQMLDDGNKLAQLWKSQKVDSEMGRLYKQAGGNQAKMMELGQQSALARFVIPQLQEQQKAKQDALIAQQKAQAEVGKLNSESFKNNQQGGGFKLDNGQKQLGAIQSAIQQASITGDKTAAIIGLDAARRVGLITPDDYNQNYNILKAMTPEEVKSYAQSVTFANAKDPASIAFQTANNVADNATSIQNNELTNRTSITNNQNTVNGQKYSVDQNVQLGQNRIEQDDRKLTYQKYVDQNKPLDYFTASDGTRYAVYPGGKGIPITDIQGNQVKATTKNSPSKLSDNALKQVNEASTQLAQAEQSYKKVGNLVVSLKSGKLNLSAASIVGAKTRGALGLTNSNDLAVNQFQTALNQAANDVLMMAKGTQTEGDAKRAIETIVANPPRDNNAAMQALNTLAGIQRNTIETLNGNINTVYDNYGIARPRANKPPTPKATSQKPSNANEQPLTSVQTQGFQSLLKKHTVN